VSALLLVADPDHPDLDGITAVADSVAAVLTSVTVGADLAALAAAGHRDVAAVALMLDTAGYDPSILRVALEQQFGGAQVSAARALGPHPLLVALAAERVEQALPGVGQADVTVLVVGLGSLDPLANAEVAKFARLLAEGRAYRMVEVAYLRHATPTVRQGLDRCTALGADRVVVLPYVVLGPTFAAAVAEQVVAGQAGGAGRAVTVAGPLGDSPQLTEVVVERFHETQYGDLRMNCDVCRYRTPALVDHV